LISSQRNSVKSSIDETNSSHFQRKRSKKNSKASDQSSKILEVKPYEDIRFQKYAVKYQESQNGKISCEKENNSKSVSKPSFRDSDTNPSKRNLLKILKTPKTNIARIGE
jgi:hypothetical protein